MKLNIKILGVIVICLAILSAVAFITYFPQITNLTNSSPIVTEERNLSGYTKIYFSGIGELEIVQTGQNGLQISAAENVLPNIKTKVENNILTIEYQWSWKNNYLNNQRPIKIIVQVADLTKIDISGSGIVSSSSLKTTKLDLSLSGASQANLTLTVDTLKSEISGAGNITLAGVAVDQIINISGAGNYNSRLLSSNNVDISISGLGSADVVANDILNIVISGGGKVSYTGKPKISQEISGLGSVTRLD